jgi:hypothetical protein
VSNKILAATSECASVADHFDGQAEALTQSTWHCLMQHVLGYIGSHWTLPSGNYLLRIAPAVAMMTINKTMMQNVPSSLALSRASLDEGGLWLSLKPLNAAIGLALTPILSIGHANAG